jgi:hypothetical protein
MMGTYLPEICREVEINILRSSDQTVTHMQSAKYQCRIDTVTSPDDGHIVARNM